MVMKRKICIYEKILKMVDKLNKSVDVIIVEGKNDLITLRRMGVNKDIITLNKINTYDLQGKKILVLTDFDSHGEKLNKKINKFLEINGGKVNQYYRKMFYEIASKRGIKQIESMMKTVKECRMISELPRFEFN
jgi:5S rRNA maturation endonuclease (ribonuclease M5)